jgi:hypothetical protein
MNIDHMADRHNDRLLNEYLDSQAEAEQREESFAEYLEENRFRALGAWLADEGETMLSDALYNSDPDTAPALKAVGYFKALFSRGKLEYPEYSELGQAFAQWVIESSEGIVSDELRKEFDKR